MAKDATPGTRAWPRQDSVVDKNIGMRWDWGERVGMGGRNLVLQANKGAEQGALRRIANKNSHTKLMTIRLDLQNPPELELFMQRWYDGLKDL